MASSDFKIKFDGEQHQIDAKILIASLTHTTALIYEINRSIDAARKIEVKVKAPEQGSFMIQLELIDFVKNATQYVNPQNIETTSYIILSLVGLFELKKHLFGSKPNDIVKQGNTVKIENKNGDIFYIDNATFNIYEKNPVVKESLSKNFESIINEPSITGFEILDQNNQNLFKAERKEFEALAAKDELSKDEERIRTESTILNIARLSFEKGVMWEFYHKGHKIKAKIEDADFQKRIDNGEAFAKGDVLEVELKIKQKWDESVKTYVNKAYSVSQITKHISRDDTSQTKLF